MRCFATLYCEMKTLNLKHQFGVDKSDCVACIGFHYVWFGWMCVSASVFLFQVVFLIIKHSVMKQQIECCFRQCSVH